MALFFHKIMLPNEGTFVRRYLRMKQGTFIYIRLYFEYEGMDTKVPRYEGMDTKVPRYEGNIR